MCNKVIKKKAALFLQGATNNPLPVLRNAKSLVLPSFSEAFPTVLLEAICLGEPVVATPTERVQREILNNLPNAYISNSFTDSDEFAKLLEQAYCQPKIDLSSYLKIYDEKSYMCFPN
ncbi:MAG: glycosyltransferase [Phocaeicola vulgatus]